MYQHAISSVRCATNGRPDSGPTGRFAFPFLYFVIVANSLVLDLFFYGSILNYMRKGRYLFDIRAGRGICKEKIKV